MNTTASPTSPAPPATWVKRARAAVRFVLDAVRHGADEIAKDKAGQIAAALTYHTLFSLLPIMALALVVLRTFVGPAEQLAFKDFIVDAAVEWLVADDGGAPAVLGEPVADATEFDATIARIDETVMGLLDRLQNVNFQSIGLIGVFVFIYAATGLLVTIERSFNQIYGAPEGRRWHLRLPLYYTTLTLAPLVIIAGQIVQARTVASLADQPWTAWLAPPMAVASPVVSSWFVFYLMYLLIPNTRVNLRAAAIGAGLAAFASAGLLELFSVYVDIYAGKSLYGSLALMPLAMMWMWLNWLIILFGLEVSYVLQTAPTRRESSTGKRILDAPALCDPRWLIIVLAAVAERFAAGERATLEAIALRVRATEATVGTLAEHLVAQGFLHRIARNDPAEAGSAYTLARPPAEIAVNELYDLWSDVAFAEEGDQTLPGQTLITRLEAARTQALASLRLEGERQK